MSSNTTTAFQKVYGKIEDAIKKEGLNKSLQIVIAMMENLEGYKLKGEDKKQIAIDVLKKIIESQILPPDVNSEIHFLIDSNLMGGIIDVICKASKGIYNLNKKGCHKLFSHKMSCCSA